ncbi:MAG: hypothetical protein WC974_05280 [Thermoplasmata archaeon]
MSRLESGKNILKSVEENKRKGTNSSQKVMKIKPIRDDIFTTPSRAIQNDIFSGIPGQLAHYGEIVRARDLELEKKKELETEIKLIEDEMKNVMKKETEKRNRKYATLEAAAKRKEAEIKKKLQEEVKKREKAEKKKGHKVDRKTINKLEQQILSRLDAETKKTQEEKERLSEDGKKRENDLRNEFEQKIKKLEEEKKKEMEAEMKKIETERKKEMDDLKTVSIDGIKQIEESLELRLEERMGKRIDDIQEKLRRTETLEEELAAIEEKLVKISRSYDKMKSEVTSEIDSRITAAIGGMGKAEEGAGDEEIYNVMEELKNSNESLRTEIGEINKKIDERQSQKPDVAEDIIDELKNSNESLQSRMDEIQRKIEDMVSEEPDVSELKDKLKSVILEESVIDEKIDEVVKRNLTQKFKEETDFTNLADSISKLQRRNDSLENDILDIQGKLMNITQRGTGEDKEKILDMEDKLAMLITGMEQERVRNQGKLASIESKLVVMLKREEEEKIKLDKLTQIEKLEGAALTESIDDLSKIYEISQRKVEASKVELTTIKEKLAVVLKKQREEEESRLKSLAKTHEVTKRRLVALEELARLEEPTPEEAKLISILRKRKEELEEELDKESDLAAILKKEIPISAPTPTAAAAPTVGFDELRSSLLKMPAAPTPPSSAPAKPVTLTCPKCKGKIEVASSERPIKIKCSACGAEGTLKK